MMKKFRFSFFPTCDSKPAKPHAPMNSLTFLSPNARLRTIAALQCACFILSLSMSSAFSQTRTYPDKIRGYKVERTVVEVKKPDGQANGANSDADVDSLIRLGDPKVASVTPLGITFEVPIVVAPVKQSGRVDFLVFEDMSVNGRSVDIDEYQHNFDLPNKTPATLKSPLRIYIYLPSALLAALGEWTESKDTWPVTGRVYVFGKFKKSIFSFKRVVPVELNLTMRNPLKEK